MDKNNFLIKKILENQNHPSLQVRINIAESEFIDFKNDLLADSDYITPEKLDNMTPAQLLEARLQYEGIYGYTDDIMKWVIQVIGLGLEDYELNELGL